MKEPKTEQLEAIMDELTDQDMALAFSGGVDSSLLLKMAADRAAKKGTKVWAVTFNSRLHPSCDLENARKVAGELEHSLRSRGIGIYCGAQCEQIEEGKSGLICRIRTADGQMVEQPAGTVLIAVGRKPAPEKLFGEDAKLRIEEGRLWTDENFQTSQEGVYAIGDLTAKTQLAHVAAAQGVFVVEALAGKPHTIRLEVVPNGMFVRLPIVPNCIYTNPEIATVGITEEAAKKLGMHVRTGYYSMNDNGKSIITRADGGFICLVFEAYSNTIVGAQMICPRATDMIGEMATAVANGLTAEQLSYAMRAHPTYSEGIQAAINDALGKC